MIDPNHLREFAARFSQLHRNVATVIKGKDEQISMALFALLCEGHLLLEDKPGTGKTSLAKSLTKSINGETKRIQFTPDLLPSDITGSIILRDGELKPRLGPVFANVVLADEINRASPKTQSALLEAMEEGQVTIEDETYLLPNPFVVIGTQNPVEQEGTYRLPEAQLDRFLLRSELGYPDFAAEVDVLRDHAAGVSSDALQPVLNLDMVQWMIQLVESISVAPEMQRYIVRLNRATRIFTVDGFEDYSRGTMPLIEGEQRAIEQMLEALDVHGFKPPVLNLGVSTRGSVSMMRAARAVAASQSEPGITPDHVNFLARSVMAHRMTLTPQAELDGLRTSQLVDMIVQNTPADYVRGV